MWKNCGEIRGKDCSNFEVHPELGIRNYDSKDKVVGIIIKGYPAINIKHRGGWIWMPLHIIVMDTLKPRPYKGLEIDHRYGVLDYRLHALRWVTHPLNISFQEHNGYSFDRGKYRTRFRNKYYGSFETAAEARAKYLYIRCVWQRNEREKIIEKLMNNGKTRTETLIMLNWDDRDESI